MSETWSQRRKDGVQNLQCEVSFGVDVNPKKKNERTEYKELQRIMLFLILPLWAELGERFP